MRCLRRILWAIAVASLLAATAEAQEEACSNKKDWRPTENQLLQILQAHREWLATIVEKDPADPGRANLCNAFLRSAFLRGANLSEAKLFRADLIGADLSEADLRGADLTGAIVRRANLSGTDLSGANLSGADLSSANLSGADLSSANLREANFFWPYQNRADLTRADLSEADLRGANLSTAKLNFADLSGADLSGADLSDVTLRDARGLSMLSWTKLPLGIYRARKSLKDAGERERERELTYAIKHNERINTGGVEGAFNYVLFEITSGYGLWPGRPLRILGILIMVMTPLYWVALSSRRGTAGIWQVWPEDRTLKNQGSNNPTRLSDGEFDFIWLGAYFSILSAFHIGWRDLNVGNWLARIQPREYVLRATGWVRVASGLQSLACVYLLALWALVYFGSPFE